MYFDRCKKSHSNERKECKIELNRKHFPAVFRDVITVPWEIKTYGKVHELDLKKPDVTCNLGHNSWMF